MYKCPECGQPTKFHDLCNNCVDKFMEELDEGLRKMDQPEAVHDFSKLNPLRFFVRKGRRSDVF